VSNYDRDRPYEGLGDSPAGGLSWADAAYYKELYGKDFHAPMHMRGMTLEQIKARAREETRGVREAQEAEASARRIANAPKSIERALLDAPRPQATPQRGWRLRVRFLNNFRRCGSYREASARIGVDESTVRRWRRKFPAFGARCDEILAERFRQNGDDLKLRAGTPRTKVVFFKGKQVGEQVIHDDRALMFLLKLEDAQRARAEARVERQLERDHEIRMKELEIAAKMRAPAAHPAAPAEAETSAPINDLSAVPADIAPREVVEVELPGTAPQTPQSSTEHQPHAEEAAKQRSRSMGPTPGACPSFETRAVRAPRDERSEVE
jgi:hypothetical protein